MFEPEYNSQDGTPWHEDYSELKTTETLWAQEKLLSLLYNWGSFPEQGSFAEINIMGDPSVW